MISLSLIITFSNQVPSSDVKRHWNFSDTYNVLNLVTTKDLAGLYVYEFFPVVGEIAVAKLIN